MASTVWLGLGSNLGDREKLLGEAIDHISRQIGTVIAQSAIFYNPSWGYSSVYEFANMAIQAVTSLSVDELLASCQEIEKAVGRTRKSINGRYEDRSIDIDIILVDELILERSNLTIPHPLFRERVFVLAPLAQISPEKIDPVTHKTIQKLLDIALLKQVNGG